MLEWLAQHKDAAPILGAIIAAISATVALIAFSHTRKVARRRATLDMVMKTFVDETGQKRYQEFKSVMHRHKDPTDALDILAFADPDCPPSPERQTVRSQLNEYELISLGIRKGLFDETLYKLWFQDQFQRDFKSLEPFICEVRKKRQSVFCECVWLYNRWVKAPHPANFPHAVKLAWWGLTRNQEKLKAYADACD